MFYHVLVDERDWPNDGDHPPVAYVAEELLTGGSSVDFSSDHPLIVSAAACCLLAADCWRLLARVYVLLTGCSSVDSSWEIS